MIPPEKLTYNDPLSSRYCDKEMLSLFSECHRHKTWRICWQALLKCQKQLGLECITDEIINSMKDIHEYIDYESADKYESEYMHDVMAHIASIGEKYPEVKKVIHLGATSQFVVCNSDLIIMKSALKIIENQLLNVISNLANFAKQYKSIPTLGYTHYQPAQPTTIGKRFAMYLQDLVFDYHNIKYVQDNFLSKTRSVKGATGTQDSFLKLFGGNKEKVKELEKMVAKELGFDDAIPITGQTYPRKIDSFIAKALSGIAESANKFAVDMRLSANIGILSEPRAKNQTGSSAMAYKANPMRCERMTSLSRKSIGLVINFSETAANQWMERTLDDSAIRRMDIPQIFLLTNAILKLYQNISNGIVVHKEVNDKIVQDNLPLMITESIMMESVKNGADRHEIHEIIKHITVGKSKHEIVSLLKSDVRIPVHNDFYEQLLSSDTSLIGMAVEQVDAFIDSEVNSIIQEHIKTDNIIIK